MLLLFMRVRQLLILLLLLFFSFSLRLPCDPLALSMSFVFVFFASIWLSFYFFFNNFFHGMFVLRILCSLYISKSNRKETKKIYWIFSQFFQIRMPIFVFPMWIFPWFFSSLNLQQKCIILLLYKRISVQLKTDSYRFWSILRNLYFYLELMNELLATEYTDTN